MTVRRERRRSRNGHERSIIMIEFVFRWPDGEKEHVRQVAQASNLRDARAEERAMIRDREGRAWHGRKEVTPTFEEWFNGRFWEEWVIGQMNKPSEQQSKRTVFKCHLKDHFGKLRLSEIAEGSHVAQFKANLAKKMNAGDLSKKSINNILAVLSKSLRYAEEARVIERAPQVKLYRLERPEIEWWEFEQYPRVLTAAREEGPEWHAAVCLAGEAGLRIGEVRALKWERDIDLVAGMITVNEQTRNGITGTPKGRTRRKVPMTSALLDAIKGLSVVRRGHVIRNNDGTPLRDGQTIHASYRICRKAGLPERGWHCLRHTFGTHAALLGANPWRLMGWMGHKTITETLRYVHVAEDHQRPLPENVIAAGRGEADPDRRIVRMLGARIATPAQHTTPLDTESAQCTRP
ncbi:MAG: site-specific integrase [Deltaproteobacteria bacterium]|nr:site-specific integrase [Deltaproteobacteria bacterium]